MSSDHFTAPSLEEMNEMLPAFEFESELSANDVGGVYYALQKSLDRYVAVKLFSPAKGKDERFQAALKESAKKVAGLKHPNIISFIDSGVVEDMPYLVMEMVSGKSMYRSTHGKVIDFKQSMGIIEEICEGMARAHESGVIHGHLSPLNILLNRKATPKIGNFGLGRNIHTLPNVKVSDHFSAPEVREGQSPTIASDVYSLGAIFYELITSIPYKPDGPRATELQENTPAGVHKVIEKACHADPKERHQSVEVFFKAVKKASTNKPKQAAVPAHPAPHERSKAMKMTMSTSGLGLAVKAVIIVALIFAIHQVWQYREGQKAKLAAQADELPQQGELVVKKPQPAPDRPKKPQRPQNPNGQMSQHNATKPPESSVIVEAPETPMQSLERLSGRLQAGDFSELPIGAITVADRHFFMVEKTMTWNQAVHHAEQMGASITLPDHHVSWSSHESFAGRQVWLGAARGGSSDEFTTLRGGAWQPAGPMKGSGDFVMLDKSGAFAVALNSMRLPYVAVWEADGSQPASLAARLAAVADSIKQAKPIYPPGTVVVGNRYYLPVSREVDWAKAGSLAKKAGGHLMVLSGEKETKDLQNWSRQLPAGSLYWLGGSLKGERWQWITDEPWGAIEWMNINNAAEDNAAMVLRAGSGVDASGKNASADGFIIEWSEDSVTERAEYGEKLAELESPSELAEKAKQVVQQAFVDKEAAHTKNTDKLAWDLNAHLRGMKKSDQNRWSPEAEKLKACVKDNRLLKETIDQSGARPSPFMADLCNYILRKQYEIDQAHEQKLEKIHEAYLDKLESIRDEAKARGQVRAQLAAEKALKSSQNGEAWIARMKKGI